MAESLIRLLPSEDQHPNQTHFPEGLIRRWGEPFEDDTLPFVRVFMAPQAYIRTCAHAGSDLDHEVGGGLVGEWGVDAETGEGFIQIEAVIQAKHTRHGGAYLTFTQDTLVAMNDDLEASHPDKQIVGWYHTHPKMGVFLSSYDLWLHRHFFPEAWQVALVIEPHSRCGGFFIRQLDGYLDPQRYYGFYELVDDELNSPVHWSNLRSQPLEEYGFDFELDDEGGVEDE